LRLVFIFFFFLENNWLSVEYFFRLAKSNKEDLKTFVIGETINNKAYGNFEFYMSEQKK
jgi:hypothetical protein